MRPNKSSSVLKDAMRRLERLKAIQPVPDLGEGFNLQIYETAVNDLKALEATYNTKISELDGMSASFKDMERMVRDYRVRILAAVAAQYGRNSDEYAAAGGTKLSERKRTTSKRFSSLSDMTV
jgi:hypothetical protein